MVTKTRQAPRTEFQIHVDWLAKNIFDFTAIRLKHLASHSASVTMKTSYYELLRDYLAGKIYIAWRDGEPVWTRSNSVVEEK